MTHSVESSRPSSPRLPSAIVAEGPKVAEIDTSSPDSTIKKKRPIPLHTLPDIGKEPLIKEKEEPLESAIPKTISTPLPKLPTRMDADETAEEYRKVNELFEKKSFIAFLKQRINTCLKAAATFTVLGTCIYPLLQFVTIVPFLELQIACCIIIAVVCLVTAAYTFYRQKKCERAIFMPRPSEPPTPNTSQSTPETSLPIEREADSTQVLSTDTHLDPTDLPIDRESIPSSTTPTSPVPTPNNVA